MTVTKTFIGWHMVFRIDAADAADDGEDAQNERTSCSRVKFAKSTNSEGYENGERVFSPYSVNI
jgi:hypothetical protein